MNFSASKYLKLIFGGTIIGAIATTIGVYKFAQQTYNDLNASIDVTLDSRQIKENFVRTIVVCLNESDKDFDLEGINIIPTYYNPCDFKLEDFSLSFDVTNNNVEIEATDFYAKNKYGINRYIYKYKEKELDKNYESAPRPFISCKVYGKMGTSKIVSKVNYRGSSEPFVCTTDVKFIVEPINDSSLEQWISKCKSHVLDSIAGNFYDGYYCYNNQIIKEFDIPLKGNVSEPKKQQPSVPVKTNKKGVSVKSTPQNPVTVTSKEEHTDNNYIKPDGNLEYSITSYNYEESYNEKYPYRLTVQLDKPIIIVGDEECIFYYKYIKDEYTVVKLKNGSNIFDCYFKDKFDFPMMKVLKMTNYENYLEIDKKGDSYLFHNKTDNKIIFKVVSKDGKESFDVLLGNQSVLRDVMPIGVFDTGIKSKISDYNFYSFNFLYNNITVLSIVIILIIVLNIFLFIVIGNYFEYKKETGDSNKAFTRIKRRFSYKVLVNNVNNESNWFINTLYIFGYILNWLTIVLVIPLDVIFFIIPIWDLVKDNFASSL